MMPISKSKPTAGVLQEAIRRIVDVADPEKIILFGSLAREDASLDSDIDLLVIKSRVHRRRLAQRIYLALLGLGHPVDVVVATPADVERFGHSQALVISTAMREGRVVYNA